jgi:hypothetical protein
LLRRIAEARAALDQLEAELSSSPSAKGAPRNTRRSAPPRGPTAEREVERLRRELAQRRLELTELRTETARALHRAEQENERLKLELADLQRRFDGALGAERRSEIGGAGPTEPPAVSGVEGRQKAETLRPRGRAKGR